MAGNGISGVGVALTTAGLYLIYAGIRDVPIVEGLRELAQGRIPAGRPPVPTDVRLGGRVDRGAVAPVGSGSMTRPVPGTIGDGFGAPRDGGTRRHMGVDIAAPTGTPIRAALAGSVTGKGYGAGSGNYVNLTHAGGLVTKYFHLSEFNVSHGQTVSAGQVIGFVGSTGNSSGPHLHFEVHVNGKAVDPAPYIGGGASV